MRAGRLDRRITIQVRSQIRDSFGQSSETWADLHEVSASYKPVRAGERFAAQQTLGEEAAVFTIRYRADLSLSPAEHRIVYRERVWNILGFSELGRREGWEIQAAAGQ